MIYITNDYIDKNTEPNGPVIQDKIHGNPQTTFPQKSSGTITEQRDNNDNNNKENSRTAPD